MQDLEHTIECDNCLKQFQPMDKWDETCSECRDYCRYEATEVEKCPTCKSKNISSGIGFAGGGGFGAYSFCESCKQVFDKVPIDD